MGDGADQDLPADAGSPPGSIDATDPLLGAAMAGLDNSSHNSDGSSNNSNSDTTPNSAKQQEPTNTDPSDNYGQAVEGLGDNTSDYTTSTVQNGQDTDPSAEDKPGGSQPAEGPDFTSPDASNASSESFELSAADVKTANECITNNAYMLAAASVASGAISGGNATLYASPAGPPALFVGALMTVGTTTFVFSAGMVGVMYSCTAATGP